MEILLIILGLICVFAGLVGCILPIVPGPPISFLALLIVHWSSAGPLDSDTLWLWGGVTLAVTVLDYVIPVWGTKKFGGTKRGMWGSTIGLIIGLFFAPFGIIIGPFLGAYVGEMSTGKSDNKKALRAALGAFLGFLAGTFPKLVASGWMAYLFFKFAF